MPLSDFDKAMQQVENGGRTGWIAGAWRPHKSPEGGTHTVAYGHKLSAAEMRGKYVNYKGKKIPWSTGLTEAQAQELYQHDKRKSVARQRKIWPNFDKLPQKYKDVLINIEFNTKDYNSKGIPQPSPASWPGLAEAIRTNNDPAVRKEMVTGYGKGKLISRAKAIADAVKLGGRPTSQVDKINEHFNSKTTLGDKIAAEYGNVKQDYPWKSLALSLLPVSGEVIGQADLAEAKQKGDVGALDILGAIPVLGMPARAAKGGWRYFEGFNLQGAMDRAKAYKSKEALINMNPADFERMAYKIRGKDGKLSPADRKQVDYLKDNWDNDKAQVPYLRVDKKGQVQGHEGRHRAIALQEMGAEGMPVSLHLTETRPDQQVSEKLFDYVNPEDWPTNMTEEWDSVKEAAGAYETMPFPLRHGDHGVATGAQAPTDMATRRPVPADDTADFLEILDDAARYAETLPHVPRAKAEAALELKYGSGNPRQNLIMDLRDKVRGIGLSDEYEAKANALNFLKQNSPELHKKKLDELKSTDPLAIPQLWEKGKLADEDFLRMVEEWWPE